MSFATAYYMKAAKPIADQLLGFGLALHQVCGVLASIQGESSFQPGIKGDKGADGKFHAFDLLQLHSDRAALIKAGCGIDLLADPAPSPEDQIKAMENLKKGQTPPPPIPEVPFIIAKKGDTIIMHQDDANSFELSMKVEQTGQAAMVAKESIIKGYEVSKNNYVVITPEEIAAQKPASGTTIQFEKFIPLAQLNPIYFESSYYIGPDDNVKSKSYSVLQKGLKAKGVAMVGRVTMRQTENVVFIVAHPDGGLVAYTAYLADEVHQIKFQTMDVSDAELEAVGQFIEAKTGDLAMSEYRDTYRENMAKLIEAKLENRELAPVEIPKPNVPDSSQNLIDLLKASAAIAQKQKAA